MSGARNRRRLAFQRHGLTFEPRMVGPNRVPIFTYRCDNGHEIDDLRRRSERNDAFVCEACRAEGNDAMMVRAGIEHQMRPHVVGGHPSVWRN